MLPRRTWRSIASVGALLIFVTLFEVMHAQSHLGQTAFELNYPNTKKLPVVDDYFGTTVADPYRWLEDTYSTETQTWVKAQNEVTFSYLETIPERRQIRDRLTELWDYERYGVPSQEGPWYIYSRNDGLQNQAVLYKTLNLDAEPDVLLDPNLLATDGTVALSGMAFSKDGRYLAYATSASGSDWQEWHVRDVNAATDLPDLVQWSKFSGAVWRQDGSGFYYSRYEAPADGKEFESVNKFQKLYFHAIGTSGKEDQLVYERQDHPNWLFDADITDDGRFLIVYQSEGTEPKNRVFLKDLQNPDGRIEPFLDQFDAQYIIVGNDTDRFYVHTNQNAPRKQLVLINRQAPSSEYWQTLIPEAPGLDVLAEVKLVGERFIAIWLTDAHEQIDVHRLDGTFERNVTLPGLGSIVGFSGKRAKPETFYAFTSFTRPTTIYRYDVLTGSSTIFKQPSLNANLENFTTVQVFYQSKDGTKIPMFLTYHEGLTKNGQNPTLLYGYGGFNISLTPSFSPAILAWIEMGGIYASANLRGGGEYGKEWHDGGRLANKQNVFDDFIAAAEYLIKEGYTSTPKLAIHGGSNGGLLVGACLNQRPELFGAALPAVGVMDMLRFHKFTIGWAWVSDYGSAETEEGFETLIKYSPLHNLQPGIHYPPTLITTADHDDRVVPGHSFKFAATLQAVSTDQTPALIRIETAAGHGAGKPTSKIIEERTDMWAFLVHTLDIDLP